MPFDPQQLTPAASLNRAVLADLPVELPGVAAAQGRRAYDLLSTAALAALIQAAAGDLELTGEPPSDGAGWVRRFDGCWRDPRPAVRAAAEALAARIGCWLGLLVLTLRQGAPASRAARPDWDAGYWAHWAGVQTILLGGGVVSGRLGRRLPGYALELLRAAGITDCAIRVAAHPAVLPLIGAARQVPEGFPAALVVDCGGTTVKRACAVYADGCLTGLRLLATEPAPRVLAATAPTTNQAQGLAAAVAALLVAGWRACAPTVPTLAPVLMVSLASYVSAGCPSDARLASYAQLSLLGSDPAGVIAALVTAQVGVPVTVHFIHDGTAAACAVAGTPQAAVILLGTALGIGFPAATTVGLRPYAAGRAGPVILPPL